jgi:hypothetical protein
MQDRYFGDVGDFGKYGLLRILHGCADAQAKLRLGVVWYLFPDESHNADGKHLGYLRKRRDYRDCDEPLFDLLHKSIIDEAAARQIKHAETSGMLPEGTQFYSEPLVFPVGMQFQDLEKIRHDWCVAAQAATDGVDLVFVDPDNGIECESVTKTSKKGPKYVYWDDIDAFVGRKQSVVIYHHPNRKRGCSHPKQIEDIRSQMSERFGNSVEVSAVRFRRGTSRAYFIIASPRHKDLLRQRLTKMCSGPWNRHFDFL